MSRMMSTVSSGLSRLCMTMTGALCAATTRAMSGSRCNPPTSLAIATPFSSAHSTIEDFMLSMDMGAPSATTAASTGFSRRISSSCETG